MRFEFPRKHVLGKRAPITSSMAGAPPKNLWRSSPILVVWIGRSPVQRFRIGVRLRSKSR